MSLLTALNLKFGFSDGVLFKDAAFQVEENDRIGLIGSNGTGKTSLFKLITGEYTPQEGGIVRGKDVRIGYMEQYLECEDNLTVYEAVLKVFSDINVRLGINAIMLLANFKETVLFSTVKIKLPCSDRSSQAQHCISLEGLYVPAKEISAFLITSSKEKLKKEKLLT
jgi:ABC-type polysaccharide/polyol phosphate transport system ATPase subunit